MVQQCNYLVVCLSPPFGRVCNGCADAAELQRADSDPGSGLPRGPEWQGHGWDCPNRLGQDTGCKANESFFKRDLHED